MNFFFFNLGAFWDADVMIPLKLRLTLSGRRPDMHAVSTILILFWFLPFAVAPAAVIPSF